MNDANSSAATSIANELFPESLLVRIRGENLKFTFSRGWFLMSGNAGDGDGKGA